jgi:hypothetical protein
MGLSVSGVADNHEPEDTNDGRSGARTTMIFAGGLSEPALVNRLQSG